MQKLLFFVLLFASTLLFANSSHLRSTNFTSSNAGTYTLYQVISEGITMTNTSGTTWCFSYQGQQQCESVPELVLTMSFNDSGGISINGDSIYSGSLVYFDINDYPTTHTFTFTSVGMTLSYSDQGNTGSLVFKKTGDAQPSTTNEAQTAYTKELQEKDYGSTARKAKVQEIKKELLATTASEIYEIADGNGLIVLYKDGHSGLIYSAPKDTKGGSSSNTFIPSEIMDKFKVLERAAARSGSKKVLAIAAQYWDWGYNDDVPQLANMLSANGYDVTYKHYDKREAGQMSDFQNWGDYGIVLISTHGVARDTKSRTTNSINMAIDLNIAPDSSGVSTIDLSSKRLIEWDNCTPDGTCHKSLLASNLFFEEYLSTLPNTLVYVSACHVGKNNAMAEVLFNKGAQTMIGYSDLVQVSFAKEQGVNIFTRLIGDESIDNIFALPTNSDLTSGYHTGIKEKDSTPAEIVVFQKEAVNYETLLASKTYDIAGSFASHDFSGVDKAFDWVFKTTSGSVFQLQGNKPSEKDVFGWKKVDNISNLSPAWYMFPLGSDVDGDGGILFDWIFIGATSQAVYKLAGVSAQGTFEYSKAINLKYTISGNKVIFSK